MPVAEVAAVRVLVIGDIVGRAGRRAVAGLLGRIREEQGIDFTIANGENAAGGVGLTPALADELLAAYRSRNPVCVIVAERKMDQLFLSSDVGYWVQGLYLNDLCPIKLWISPNKSARAAKSG